MSLIDFPAGLTFHTKKEKSVFVKEFKKILKSLNVAFADICCPNQISDFAQPLNFNSIKGTLEYTGPNGTQSFGIRSTATNLIFLAAVVEKRTAIAANVTQTLTAAPLSTGLITSTSLAPVVLTLPTATLMAAQLVPTRGTSFEFVIDNFGGANIVTLVLGAGMTLPSPVVITGSDILVVAANQVGIFKLYFTSGTTAKLFRTS